MMNRGLASEAGIRCKVAAFIVALHAILAYAQFTSMAQDDDRTVFAGLLAIGLASAGGIFAGSRLFACIAIACCLAEVVWVLDSDNVSQFVRLVSINAIGWLGALSGASASVACHRIRDVQLRRSIHFGTAAPVALLLIGAFSIAWSFHSYFAAHD